MQIALMKNELICINPESATNRLVLLHGWGADAEDLIPIGRLITAGMEDHFEIISLSAPETHPDGVGRQWYSLYPHKWEDVPNAVLDLERRLKNLSIDKISFQKTLLLGFSQGGAMALEIAQRINLGGIFALSSYPHPDWNPQGLMPPIFLCHGTNDQVVPIDASKKSFDLLNAYGNKSELYFFNGGHEITFELIEYCQRKIKEKFLS